MSLFEIWSEKQGVEARRVFTAILRILFVNANLNQNECDEKEFAYTSIIELQKRIRTNPATVYGQKTYFASGLFMYQATLSKDKAQTAETDIFLGKYVTMLKYLDISFIEYLCENVALLPNIVVTFEVAGLHVESGTKRLLENAIQEYELKKKDNNVRYDSVVQLLRMPKKEELQTLYEISQQILPNYKEFMDVFLKKNISLSYIEFFLLCKKVAQSGDITLDFLQNTMYNARELFHLSTMKIIKKIAKNNDLHA